MSAYRRLVDEIKNSAKKIIDDFIGRTVDIEIRDQLQLSRYLSGEHQDDARIVLDALRLANKFKAFNISEDEADAMMRKYAKGEL